MSFLDFLSKMYPYYFLGLIIFFSVYNSEYRKLLAFNKKSFFKFFTFMVFASIYRIVMIKTAAALGHGIYGLEVVKKLPIGGVFFVGWEDVVFSLPLVLLGRMIGSRFLTWPIHAIVLLLTMASFASGHVYQGFIPAMFLSLYVPFGVYWGQKRGYGTLMACHVVYDFLTILAIKIALG